MPLKFNHYYLIGSGDFDSANRVAAFLLIVGVYDESDGGGKDVDEEHQQHANVQSAKHKVQQRYVKSQSVDSSLR